MIEESAPPAQRPGVEERVEELPKLDQSAWGSWTPVKPAETLGEELREFGQDEELQVADRLKL